MATNPTRSSVERELGHPHPASRLPPFLLQAWFTPGAPGRGEPRRPWDTPQVMGGTGDGEGVSKEGTGTPTGILEAIWVGVGNPAREAESGRISALHSNVLQPLHLCRCEWGSEAGAGETCQGRADVLPQDTSLLQPQNGPWLNSPLPLDDKVETEVEQELMGN
uniref:Uncharacterized protein n=1 Tax=Molossus molossus TaxID=27622 RepID=A0A7J8HBZ7_MOLMO|nr:hypothetical protein HJG59_011151 [Molossus molossus]